MDNNLKKNQEHSFIISDLHEKAHNNSKAQRDKQHFLWYTYYYSFVSSPTHIEPKFEHSRL